MWIWLLPYLFSVPITAQPYSGAYFTTPQALLLGRALPSTRSAYPPVSLPQFNVYKVVQEYQPVVHRLRPSSPRLRPRLTLGGRTFPRKPWAFDVQVSRLHLVTHTGILSTVQSTSPPGLASARTLCSSTARLCEPEASVVCFSPVTFSAHNHSTSELLRTL